MPSRVPNRLLLIIPAARVAAINTWVKTNLNPTGGDWFRATLSASGNAPATHAWANFAADDDGIDKMITQLCAIANVNKKADFKESDKEAKKNWIKSARAQLKNKAGFWLVPMDNDGEWDAPESVLTDQGLKVINA